MIELWAAVGRFVVDKDFHEKLFNLAKFNKPFEDLIDLQKFLCGTLKLRLSRLEVCVINQMVKERYRKSVKWEEIKSITDDKVLLDLRSAWSFQGLSFPEDIEVCAMIGLACVDMNFRVYLLNASSEDPKKLEKLKKLVQNPDLSPAFRVGSGELALVNQFIRADKMLARLSAFRNEKWVPENHCITGFTQHLEGQEPYIYISEMRIQATEGLLERLKNEDKVAY